MPIKITITIIITVFLKKIYPKILGFYISSYLHSYSFSSYGSKCILNTCHQLTVWDGFFIYDPIQKRHDRKKKTLDDSLGLIFHCWGRLAQRRTDNNLFEWSWSTRPKTYTLASTLLFLGLTFALHILLIYYHYHLIWNQWKTLYLKNSFFSTFSA